MQSWVSIAVSLIAIYLATNEGRWQIAKTVEGKLSFPVGVFTRAVYVPGLILSAAGLVLPSSERIVAADDWLSTVILILLAVAVVITWPKRLVLDSETVTEIAWGGMRKRSVPWSGVLHAIRIEMDDELEVHLILDHGKPIKHTKLHVDRARFIREAARHVEVFGGPPRVL